MNSAVASKVLLSSWTADVRTKLAAEVLLVALPHVEAVDASEFEETLGAFTQRRPALPRVAVTEVGGDLAVNGRCVDAPVRHDLAIDGLRLLPGLPSSRKEIAGCDRASLAQRGSGRAGDPLDDPPFQFELLGPILRDLCDARNQETGEERTDHRNRCADKQRMP